MVHKTFHDIKSSTVTIQLREYTKSSKYIRNKMSSSFL
jgi:hypothetical protein